MADIDIRVLQIQGCINFRGIWIEGAYGIGMYRCMGVYEHLGVCRCFWHMSIWGVQMYGGK